MATAFRAEIVTPERVLYSGEVEEVLARTDVGEIAFLAHHTELAGALDIAVVTLQGETESLRFAVHGGFVHVAANTVTVLAPVAETGDEIDVARARAALESARDRLGREAPDSGDRPSGARLALLAPGSPAAALRRAEVRLEASGAGEG